MSKMEHVTISTEGMDCWDEGRRVIGSGYDGENYVCSHLSHVVSNKGKEVALGNLPIGKRD